MVKTFMEVVDHNSNNNSSAERQESEIITADQEAPVDTMVPLKDIKEDQPVADGENGFDNETATADPSVMELASTEDNDEGVVKTPRFGGLAEMVETSLRSLQSASSALYHMTFAKTSESDAPFLVTAKELSDLSTERTHQALARLLERAASNLPAATADEAESLRNNRVQIEALVKRIGTEDDDEGHRKAFGGDSTEAIQRKHDMEMAANALATVILRSKPDEGIRNEASDLEFRRTTFGTNAIAEKKLDSFLKLCWNAVQDFVLLMLIALGIIGILVETTIGLDPGEQCGHCWLEGAAILTSVCIVVLVTAGIDYAKQFAFVRLTRNLNETNTKMVVRDGQQLSVTDDEIVVGDILSVNSHNLASIPADCVVLGPSQSGGLKMDESTLTGESVLISKNPGDVVLSGTTTIQGSAKMVVIAVGTNSVAGKIKAHVYESSDHEGDGLDGDENSPLFVKLEKIAKQIGLAGTAAAALSLIVNCIKGFAFGDADPKEALIEYVVTAITVLAVAVPEGLPLAVTLALAYSSNKMMKEQNLVKHLDACETMGCATTICTDKVSGWCFMS
jgi:magnesium-transporting ATPase (P-type)